MGRKIVRYNCSKNDCALFSLCVCFLFYLAIGEDGTELSAAGQNSTYLGCKTEEEIFKAITKCWASAFSYTSVQYRQQHGLPVKCDMAVLIQKMVVANCAGVLFTCQPATGNQQFMVITSNYGLGEV